MLKTHNLLDILDFLILHDLVVLRLAYIEKFTPKREDTKVISADNSETSDCERLG